MPNKQPNNAKNYKLQIAERRNEVARLYCAGYPQQEISELMGVTQACISNDIAAIHARWLAEGLIGYDEKVKVELDNLAWIEQEARAAWVRSCQDGYVRKKVEEMALRVLRKDKIKEAVEEAKKNGKAKLDENGRLVPVRRTEETTVRGQAGDERFLARAFACVEMRLKLIGALDKDDKGSGGTVININWDSLHERPKETPADIIEGKIAAVKDQIPLNGESK